MATFGNTSAEATVSGPLSQLVFVVKYQTPADCTSIDKMTVKLSNTRTGHGACNVKGLIYAADGVGGRPSTRVTVGNAIAVADSFADWKDLTFGANSVSASTYYWWGLIGDDGAVGLGSMVAATGGTDYVGTGSYTSPASPLGGTEYEFSTTKMSIYVTYTPTASGISIPLLNHLLLGD